MINGSVLKQGGFQLKGLPIIVRLAVPIFVFLTVLIILLEIGAHMGSVPNPTDPPLDLLPGKQRFPTAAGCEALHDGSFLCHVNLNGSGVDLTYDGITQRIVYTSISTPNQTIGDLINAWGRPTGYTHTGESIVVFWSTRSAYLAPYSFKPQTLVKYVAYGDLLKQTAIWRGFTTQDFSEEAHSLP